MYEGFVINQEVDELIRELGDVDVPPDVQFFSFP
jgi:hypothetical protein